MNLLPLLYSFGSPSKVSSFIVLYDFPLGDKDRSQLHCLLPASQMNNGSASLLAIKEVRQLAKIVGNRRDDVNLLSAL